MTLISLAPRLGFARLCLAAFQILAQRGGEALFPVFVLPGHGVP
jgi:hypothetical protein